MNTAINKSTIPALLSILDLHTIFAISKVAFFILVATVKEKQILIMIIHLGSKALHSEHAPLMVPYC